LDVLGNQSIIAPVVALCRRIPALRVILNHLPFGEWDGKPDALRSVLRELAPHPNLYVKVSNVVRRQNERVIDDPDYYRPGLDLLLDTMGPDRLVHGTNWPVSERVAPYATVHGIVADYFGSKSTAVAENYFWRNSHRAYRWLPRGQAAGLVK
jgi:L-fuconolactonase